MLYLDSFFGLSLAVKDIHDSIYNFFLLILTISEFIHGKPHAFFSVPHRWRFLITYSLDKVTEIVVGTDLLKD